MGAVLIFQSYGNEDPFFRSLKKGCSIPFLGLLMQRVLSIDGDKREGL